LIAHLVFRIVADLDDEAVPRPVECRDMVDGDLRTSMMMYASALLAQLQLRVQGEPQHQHHVQLLWSTISVQLQ
jgi:hypothetical protein